MRRERLDEAAKNEKLRWPVLGSGAFAIEDFAATYLEAGAGFTVGAGLAAAVVLAGFFE
jgi:hypothetical protein